MSGLQVGTAKRPAGRPRRTRVDRLTTAWMIIAAALLIYNQVFGGSLSQQWWTAVHIVTLGVISNAILQWSWYFSRSLLRLRPDDPHSGAHQTARQLLFNVALVGLVAAMWTANSVGAMVGATAIGLIILWHVVALLLASRTALGARFAVIIRYYVAAGVFLVIGCIYATLVTVPLLSADAPQVLLEHQNGLTVAHSLVNGLGWVGLTIAGTLVTLGPTALRTRMEADAVDLAVRALPVLIISVLGAAVASSFELFPLAGIFTLVYVVAMVWGVGLPLWQAERRKPVVEASGWNFALGILWSVLGLVWLAVLLLVSNEGTFFREEARAVVAVIGVGGVLQVLTGALTYLLPVVVGGGPAAVRVGNAIMERGAGLRMGLRNAALILLTLQLVLPGSNSTLVGVWAAAISVSYILEIVAFAQAGIGQAKEKRLKASEGELL